MWVGGVGCPPPPPGGIAKHRLVPNLELCTDPLFLKSETGRLPNSKLDFFICCSSIHNLELFSTTPGAEMSALHNPMRGLVDTYV